MVPIMTQLVVFARRLSFPITRKEEEEDEEKSGRKKTYEDRHSMQEKSLLDYDKLTLFSRRIYSTDFYHLYERGIET